MAHKVSVAAHAPPLLWRSKSGQYTVTIHRSAYRAMVRMAILHHPREVGTSLVGRYSNDGFRAEVLSIAPLTADSIGTRNSFVRGIQGLRQFYKRLVWRFHGQRYYVGEWHSHPDSAPHSSGIDDANQTLISRDKSANCSEVILIIVGGDFARKPELRINVYSRKNGRVLLFPIIA